MVASTGAGPAPIPHKELTVDALTEGIRYCLSERAATAASAIAAKMDSEAGVHAAVQVIPPEPSHRTSRMRSMSGSARSMVFFQEQYKY
jgi:hypothetical protein